MRDRKLSLAPLTPSQAVANGRRSGSLWPVTQETIEAIRAVMFTYLALGAKRIK